MKKHVDVRLTQFQLQEILHILDIFMSDYSGLAYAKKRIRAALRVRAVLVKARTKNK